MKPVWLKATLLWVGIAQAAVLEGKPWDDAEMGRPLVEVTEAQALHIRGPVWAAVTGTDGRSYVGADQLVVIDGERTEAVALPNVYGFRGLAVTAGGGGNEAWRGPLDRVWIGAIGQLGWVEDDAAGRPQFRSLLPELKQAGVANPGPIWKVFATADGIVFAGEQAVYRWDGKTFAVFELPSSPRLLAYAAGTEVWLYQTGTGLLRLADHGPKIMWNDAQLPDKPLLWAAETRTQQTVVGTIAGAWRRTGATWTRLAAVSAALKGKLADSAAALDGDTVAVGTYLNGIVVFSAGDRVQAVLDRGSGMRDDSVQSLTLDRDGSLVAGLANGYARLPAPGALSHFDAGNGFTDGPVLGVMAGARQHWVVVPRGSFRIADRVGGGDFAGLKALPPVETVIRDAARIGPDLFVGGFGGIWRYGSEQEWSRERYSAGDVFAVAASHRRRHWLYFMEGFALKALELTERGWATRDLQAHVGDTPTGLVEDGEGDVWVSTVTQGVTRFRWWRSARLTVAGLFRPGAGLPSGTVRPVVVTAGGRPFLFTDGAILGLADPNTFRPVGSLAGFAGIAASQGETANDPADWILERRDLPGASSVVAEISPAPEGQVRPKFLTVPGLATVGRTTSVLTDAGDHGPGTLWVGGTHGILRVDGTALSQVMGLQKAEFSGVTATLPSSGTDGPPVAAMIPLGEATVRPFNSGLGSLQLSYRIAGEAGDGAPFFQTKLDGAETEWSSPTHQAQRELTGLAPGRYVFRVRAVNGAGAPGPEASFAFEKLAPWYGSWPAEAGYAVLGLAATLGASRIRMRRLRRQNERLNRLVDERTRELAMSNTAKTDFLATISHEIRNPLNGVVGLIAMLKESAVGVRERELARSLGACARTLTRVFEEVLNFSKIEYGQIALRPKNFTLQGLLEEVVGVFQATADQRGSALRLKLEPQATELLCGDEEKIATIVSNFVANALKYAPGTLVEIGANLEPAKDGGFTLDIHVTDHGKGVPATEHELIFRKFVRGSSAKEQSEPGAGLGLATCSALAELMSGGVGIESEPGEGATFYLRVPVARAGSQRAAVRAVEEETNRPAPWVGSESGRALIVEDQEYNQIVMRRIAERLGFEPEIAPDAAAALAKRGGGPCAVVFLDWDLPGMKGNELAPRLREMPGGEEMIILATTAHDSDEIRRGCFEAGMDGFILKPFDEPAVVSMLAEVRTRRSREEAGASGQLNFGMFRFVGEDDPQKSAAALDQYLAMLDREWADLDGAVARADWVEAAHFAHRLRSHAGIVRAGELAQSARLLEERMAVAAEQERASLLMIVGAQTRALRQRLEMFKASGKETA